ncbi:hypothetical protein QTH90_25920 [Variovorax sp. J2P1-59]|uniref:hypothetical protein n=1 Tax=Variovorax flavidus TaxID=3053501 RepID=UPI002576B1C5|nr:hypothetical protein [Variovorax sp. J2P1-59]MDM0077873.1 hypothetical protein [Variovorax sp. J2P1-59]
MTQHPMHAAIFCAALVPGAAVFAQQDLAAAQQRYQRALAYCNNGTLPRPERDACVRDAGNAWDRARGGISTDDEDVTSPGGRATVVVPDGSPPPLSDSTTVTSPDGRSTIVLPAGGSRPLPNQ